MFKKLTLFFAALTLSVGLWAETVAYRYPVYNEGGVTKGIDHWVDGVKDATPITSTSFKWGISGETTWFVVNENVTISQRVECLGDVRLILANGVTLTAQQGITVFVPDFLTIYAQTEDIAQMGQLIANGAGDAAGIGGGHMGYGSNITINGGIVIAKGGGDANGGGTGIGGAYGLSGSDIVINGGKVEATGGKWAAGIGGGSAAPDTKNITINGGIVIAKGGGDASEGGAGIGGGSYCPDTKNITINGGTVTAIGGAGAAGIGAGMGGSASDIFVATTCIVKAGSSPNPTNEIENDGGDLANSLAGKQYATIEPKPTPVPTTYLDENGVEQNIDAWEVKDATAAVTWGTAGETTWYVVNGTNVQLAKGAICAGDVRLILADNAKLTATGWFESDERITHPGIQVSGEGNSLTIYAQSTGDEMGQLFASGYSGSAGIGCGQFSSGSNITINGGKVTATGGGQAAGIGGGQMSNGSNITINGGEVTATGKDNGAGIGGGYNGSGSNITINGGEVTATGGSNGVGIGGGRNGSGSDITINGGIVTATGGYDAAGIGGGNGGSASDIYISDAYVLKAGAAADPTDVIAHSSATDMAGTLTQQYVKIEGLATPYTRTVTNGQWATVCLPYASTVFSGAKFYRVNYYDGADKLYIEEVSSLVAGQPYIFHATDETLTISHNATAPEVNVAGKDRGLQGLFARTIIATDGSQAALSNNAVQWLESDLEITVPACRAYFDMNNVPREEQPHSSAPLRCIRVPRQTPTDFENVTLDEDATKILRNGQLIIIRDGKEYNAQGMQL